MQPINIFNSQDVKVTIDENGTPVDVYVNGGLATSVLFYADYASLPAQGEGGILYVTEDTNFIYRWDGAYVQVGGGAASLQDVTDVGNTTTNDIQLINDADVILGAGGKVLMDNGSKLQEGTTDAGNGGSKGIALKCSVDYELKWEAGRLYTMEQDGFTIREVSHNFTFAPSVNDDDSKGFVVGSRWILDNGDIYTCTDATTGAAVWELNVISWGDIQGTLSYQTDLQTALDGKVDENSAITGATKTKITYDSKGLVTSGSDAGISDISGLQTALDGKVPYVGATGNVNLGEYGLTGGYYQFDTTPTTYTQAVANVGWNDTDGTIETLLKGGSVVLEIGQKLVSRVVNGTGGNVLRSNYQVVKVTGAQGQRLQVNLAQGNNDANSADTLGLIAENISNNQSGFIVTSGIISEINTTGSLQSETWADGDPLYLSPTTPGKVTNVKPQAPNHAVTVGFVVYAHSVHGKIFVKIDNGWELDELHNVKINTPLNGQVLRYNGTTFVWENSNDSDNLTFNAPLSRSVNAISISQASASANGYLSSSDWSTFNSKEPALTKGNLTESTSSVLTISGGSSAVIGSGTTIQVKQASSIQSGYLSSTDWSTFNGKQNALTNPVTGTGTNNEIAYFNTTGSTIGSLSTATYPSLTELSYVKGVTSAIQTQLNGKQAALTNPITGTGTSGQVAYFNGTTTQTGSNNLFWDNTNGRLGVGTASPGYNLDINGNGRFQSNVILSKNNNDFLKLTVSNTTSGSASEAQIEIISSNGSAYFAKYSALKTTYKTIIGNDTYIYNGTSGDISILNDFASGKIKFAAGGSSTAHLEIASNGTLTSSASATASSAIARGVNLTPTLTAAANNDVLVGLDINPTFTNGAFTGVNNIGLRVNSSGPIFNGTTTASSSYIGFAYFYAPNLTANQTASWYFGKESAAKNNASLGFTFVGNNSNSNYVSLAFNGVATPPLTVFASGNTAIGITTDSGYKLDVNGTARVQGNLTTNLTAGSIPFIGTGGLLSQNNSSLFWDNTNGRLGIGTNSPTTDLTVNKSVGSGGGVGIRSQNTNSGGEAFLAIYNDLNEYGALEIFGSTYSGSSLQRKVSFTSSANNGFAILLNNDSSTADFVISTRTSLTERLRVVGSNGYVGIGTNNPQYILDVNGTSRIYKDQNAGTLLEISNTTSGTGSFSYLSTLSDSASRFNLGKYSATTTAYKILSSGDGYLYNNTVRGDIAILNDYASGKIKFATGGSSTVHWQIESTGQLTASDAINIAFGTTTGTKIGTATSQKIGFWNATPIVQPTTAVAASTLVSNLGTPLTDTDTFDGYTLKQIVKALRNTGILA